MGLGDRETPQPHHAGREHDGDITVLGSGELVRSLLAAGLLDGLVLQTFPIALGSGTKLFADGDRVDLELRRSAVAGSGVILAEYAVRRAGRDDAVPDRAAEQLRP